VYYGASLVCSPLVGCDGSAEIRQAEGYPEVKSVVEKVEDGVGEEEA